MLEAKQGDITFAVRKIPNLLLKSAKNCDSQCYQSVDLTFFIQVYLEQLEAGSVSKLVGRYFWDKNVCCVLLPQHHVMISSDVKAQNVKRWYAVSKI